MFTMQSRASIFLQASSSRESLKETAENDIFRAALHGDNRRLDILVKKWRRFPMAELLGFACPKGRQRLTPLIAAASRGHLTVVEMLLEKYGVDPEQTGTIVVDNVAYVGVTPLWCAVAFSYVDVVRCLVERGADVHRGTSCRSSPLHAAAFGDQVDAVEYLLDHDADLDACTTSGVTCLMFCCKKRARRSVRFLLTKRVDLHKRDRTGRTALHFAAGEGHLDVVKDLVEDGAASLQDDYGMSPLATAAASGQADVVDFLVGLDCVSRREEADALELLGATIALDFSLFDSLAQGFKYLEKGMAVRCREGDIPKPDYPPVAAYGGVTESATMAELRDTASSHDGLASECLTARERILGAGNPEVASLLARRASFLAEVGSFQACLPLLLHAVEVHSRRRHGASCSRTLTPVLLGVYSRMVRAGHPVSFHDLRRAIQYAVSEMERRGGERPGSQMETERYFDDVTTTLSLVDMALAVGRSGEEIRQLRDLALRLVEQVRRAGVPFTTLHVAMELAPKGRLHPAGAGLSLTSLLLACGEDANARDSEGNTVLHALATQRTSSCQRKLRETIQALVKAGAHVDSRNAEGRTPVNVSTTDSIRGVFQDFLPLSLKCLAAVHVGEKDLFRGRVPDVVAEFVRLHFPPEPVSQ